MPIFRDIIQAKIWKAYSDIEMRKRGYELVFINPLRAEYRIIGTPSEEKSPQQPGGHTDLDTQ